MIHLVFEIKRIVDLRNFLFLTKSVTYPLKRLFGFNHVHQKSFLKKALLTWDKIIKSEITTTYSHHKNIVLFVLNYLFLYAYQIKMLSNMYNWDCNVKFIYLSFNFFLDFIKFTFFWHKNDWFHSEKLVTSHFNFFIFYSIYVDISISKMFKLKILIFPHL
jgi:hypothetical protein